MSKRNSKQLEGYDNPVAVITEIGSDSDNKKIDNEEISEPDINLVSTLDLNKYATRKTIAQGMLDLALLAANASQLKFILTAGETHQFYSLILSLVIFSIVLQVLQAVLYVILGLVFDLNKVEEHKSANLTNNICLSLNILTVVVNVVISAFDMKTIEELQSRILPLSTMT